MAWTNPKTWVAGAVVGTAELNTQLRDNLRLLKTAINGSGHVAFVDATELTIASGAITVTQNYHRVDTEANEASDDLDTITAGVAVRAGFLLCLRVEHTARAITLKDGTGNLALGRDIVLHSANHMAVLVYDGTHWRAVTMAGGSRAFSGAPSRLRPERPPAPPPPLRRSTRRKRCCWTGGGRACLAVPHRAWNARRWS